MYKSALKSLWRNKDKKTNKYVFFTYNWQHFTIDEHLFLSWKPSVCFFFGWVHRMFFFKMHSVLATLLYLNTWQVNIPYMHRSKLVIKPLKWTQDKPTATSTHSTRLACMLTWIHLSDKDNAFFYDWMTIHTWVKWGILSKAPYQRTHDNVMNQKLPARHNPMMSPSQMTLMVNIAWI